MIQRMLAIWSLVPLPFLKPDGIPVELFQILKDDAVNVLHSICQQIWKSQQWPQNWKRSVFISIPKKGNAKECSNYCTIALISHASKVMLKILQARLQQYVNRELPDVQAGFRKGRGTRDQISNIFWVMEKAKEFQKNIYFCFIDYAITVRSPQNGKCQLDSRVNQSHKTSAGFETTFNWGDFKPRKPFQSDPMATPDQRWFEATGYKNPLCSPMSLMTWSLTQCCWKLILRPQIR